MGATIYFRNAKIVVPVTELADALHQLTIAEATLDAFARSNGMSSTSTPAPAPVEQATASLPRTEQVLALEFLKLIREFSRSGGATQSEVMRVLGASHPKGIGSKAAVVNRALASAGFKVENVYSNDHDLSGSRFWKAGTDLDLAIAALSTPGGAVLNIEDKQETLI